MRWPILLSCAPLVLALIGAALIDARVRRIPNWLTFGLLLGGLARALASAGLPGLEKSALGMLAGASLPLVLYAISALGAGDVKLLAAIGSWLGAGPALLVFMIEALIGLAIVIVQATAQKRTRALVRNSALIALSFAGAAEMGLENAVETGKSCQAIRRPLPYAVPVLFATLIVMFMTATVWR